MTNRGNVGILGCGSAKPANGHMQASQLLTLCDKQFLIDCGEGVQTTLAHNGWRVARLDNIFISHLHGDHCFGLLGLLSTWGMLGRTRSISVFAQPDLEKLLRPLLNYFCSDMPYEVHFEHINPNHHEVVYSDRTLTVESLPLKHKVPCCGFLFREKQRLPHILPEAIERYGISIADIAKIKNGDDYTASSGEIIPNAALTRPADKPVSYAYCSDTAYSEKIIPWIDGIDLLYHEATYLNENIDRAKRNMHSTAAQAATIAKMANVKQLIIGHYSSNIKDENQLLAEAQQVFPNTLLAREGQRYAF